MIDIKGDLPNLLLSFPTFDAAAVEPWIDGTVRPGDARSRERIAHDLALERKTALESWGIGEGELRQHHDGHCVRLTRSASVCRRPTHHTPALPSAR